MMLFFIVIYVVLLQVNSFHLPSNAIKKINKLNKFNQINIVNNKITNKLYSEIEPIQSKDDSNGFDIAAWFNPNTRGGVIVWSILLITLPIGIYNYYVSTGLESYQVGAYVGASVVLISNLLWASTYIFRVATKDMTYARQLRDYENAVLQKRLDELGDDEINALMEEIDRDDETGSVIKSSSVTIE